MPAFPSEFLFASGNEGKAAELRALLAERGLNCVIKTYADFGLSAPDETGDTFFENAAIKALAGFDATGLPCLADDSGLCIDALGGDPGVYSADLAEQDDGTRDFQKAMDLIDQELEDDDRAAAFVSTLVLVLNDGETLAAEGRVEGMLLKADAPQGKNGFGYDPWFVPQGYDQSFGVLPAEVKNAHSHRKHALDALLQKTRPE